MTITSDVPGPRTAEPGYAHYVVHDGYVTAYSAGSFIEISSADGRTRRYAMTAATRYEAARLAGAAATVTIGQQVNLTARLEGSLPRATVIRLGAR